MAVPDIVDSIVSFVKVHQSWTIPIAFLVAFGESICFLSLIWPGTAILVGIAALIAASGVEIGVLWPAIIAAALGGSVGYAASYWVGWYFKDSIPRIWPFSTHPDLIPRGEEFFQNYGAWGVFLGHFFGPVRAVIPVVAGMFRMPQIPFQIANFASAFLWAAGVIAPAFFLVTFKGPVLEFISQHQLMVAAALGALAFLNAIPMALFAVPTLVLFVGLGALCLYAGGAFLPLLIAGAVGAWGGDLYVYNAGRTQRGENKRRSFHTIWPEGWSAETAAKATTFVLKWRAVAFIMSKFHTTYRAFAPLAAGAVGYDLVPFILASLAGSAIWSGVLLAPWPLAQRVLGW